MNASQSNFSLQDVPFFLLLGFLAGVLGTIFSRGIFKITLFNRRALQRGLAWKMGLAGVINFFTMLSFYLVSNSMLSHKLFSLNDVDQ